MRTSVENKAKKNTKSEQFEANAVWHWKKVKSWTLRKHVRLWRQLKRCIVLWTELQSRCRKRRSTHHNPPVHRFLETGTPWNQIWEDQFNRKLLEEIKKESSLQLRMTKDHKFVTLGTIKRSLRIRERLVHLVLKFLCLMTVLVLARTSLIDQNVCDIFS